MDYGVYYLDLAASDKKWAFEYMFAEVYKQTEVNAAALQKVYDAIEAQGPMRTKYMDYFDASHRHRAVLTPANWRTYWCAIANLRQDGFETCMDEKK